MFWISKLSCFSVVICDLMSAAFCPTSNGYGPQPGSPFTIKRAGRLSSQFFSQCESFHGGFGGFGSSTMLKWISSEVWNTDYLWGKAVTQSLWFSGYQFKESRLSLRARFFCNPENPRIFKVKDLRNKHVVVNIGLAIKNRVCIYR